MTDLLAYRDRFPILRETTYLINHSLAAMPAAAEERLLEYARMWRERGIRAWGEGWWDMPLTVGDQVGRIVGAPPGTVCIHQNVTVAVAERWGRLSVARPLPTIDGLLAATALEHGLTLVTRDTRSLARTGVALLDPWQRG